MRKLFVVLLLLACAGCAGARLPKYIDNDISYERKFYTPFAPTLAAVEKVLAADGWTIAEKADPSTYEENSNYNGDQVLLFTQIKKQMAMLFFSKSSHLNVYVRGLDSESTQVEIRYESVTSVIKGFKNARNDRFVDGIFDHISEALRKQ